VIAGIVFCCCIAAFLLWRQRKAKQEKTTFEDIMAEGGSENKVGEMDKMDLPQEPNTIPRHHKYQKVVIDVHNDPNASGELVSI